MSSSTTCRRIRVQLLLDDGTRTDETFEADLCGYPPAEHGGLYDYLSDNGTPDHVRWDEILFVDVA